MGLAWFTVDGLVAQLRGFARQWAVRRGRRAGTAAACINRPAPLCMQPGRAHVSWASARRPAVQRRPLHVLRVVEACHAPSSAGRMVISGRMADVCAELDRLAALEAARS